MLIWIILAIIFGIAEIATTALVSIWFVVGAIGAAICAYFGCSLLVQIIVFIVLSIIGIVIFCLFFKNKVNKKIIPTNLDRLKNEICIVVEDIDTITGEGRVEIKGQSWAVKVRNSSVEKIAKGTRLKVVDFEGAKAIVEEI